MDFTFPEDTEMLRDMLRRFRKRGPAAGDEIWR
jgi:hypothetical protein